MGTPGISCMLRHAVLELDGALPHSHTAKTQAHTSKHAQLSRVCTSSGGGAPAGSLDAMLLVPCTCSVTPVGTVQRLSKVVVWWSSCCSLS